LESGLETSLTTPAKAAAFDTVGCELAASILRSGQPVRIRAAGSSMLPALWPHDELHIAPLAGPRPTRGDILLYTRNARLFEHRVVAETGDTDRRFLITRGDSLTTDDPPVSSAEVLGTVAAVFRNGRNIPVPNRALSTPHRIASWAIRRFDVARRVALKLHAMRRSSIETETACRA